METLDQNGSNGNAEEGNTKLPQPRCTPSKYWCFTLNNYTKDEMDQLETIFKSFKIEYYFGEEVGENGTPHLQGFIKSGSKIRPLEKIKNKRIHWEKTKGNEEQNITYCSKDNKIHTNMKFRRPIIDDLADKKLYNFQRTIKELIDIPSDGRSIHWMWEETGNVGKTSISRHLCITNPNEVLFVSGKSSDIKFAVIKFLENPKNDLKLCIFYFTKTYEEFVSYEAIESIADGIFFSGKYESGMCIFNKPQIVCLANFEPDINALSLDRWKIKNVKKDIELSEALVGESDS